MGNKLIRLAGCVILDPNARLLLIHRNCDRQVQWEIPGGRVKENETPAAAAVREVWEELGIKVRILRRLGKAKFEENNLLFECTWFLAGIFWGKPKIVEIHKFDKFDYFSMSQILEIYCTLSSGVKKLIDKNTLCNVIGLMRN
jgi:8-oxo-dGTP pyrophosphatase MutT (NUDIX family)